MPNTAIDPPDAQIEASGKTVELTISPPALNDTSVPSSGVTTPITEGQEFPNGVR